MTQEDFVQSVKTHALDVAVNDTIHDLQDPPGRVLRPAQVAAQKWYAGLDSTSREFVEHVARMAAESAAFGIMAILDSVRAVSANDRGQLVLEHRNGSQSVRLNGFDQELLHDLLAGWFDYRARWEKPPLDLHHVPQCNVAMKHVKGYTPENGPCIALPTREHKNIAREKSPVRKSVESQREQDLKDLQDWTNVPEAAIERLAMSALKK